MRIKAKMKGALARVTSGAMAAVLAVGLMPLPAFAAQDDLQAADANLTAQASASYEGHILGAAFAAAEAAPDILGLDNPEQRNDAKASDMKLAIFGTDINRAPDPFFENTYQVLNGIDPSASPTIITDGRATAQGGVGFGGPMAARAAYGADEASDAVWNLLPDVVIGTGQAKVLASDKTMYDQDAYARAVESAKGLAANSYKPLGVAYVNTNLNTMLETMYTIAAYADEVAANDSAKHLRYTEDYENTATKIAQNYERYIIGQKGLVLKAINNGTVTVRTVANVSSYDADSKTYTIIADGVQEGTATQNRFLEVCQGVAYNLYDTTGATVTVDQLKSADLVMIGGQSGAGTYGKLGAQLQADGLLDKTYYMSDSSTGAIFGVTMNSVENATNVGRILPCLYPEVLDQSNMVAYYFDMFYHIKAGSLGSTIAKWMNGAVRNWNQHESASMLNWSEADVQDYNRATVQAQLEEGVAYLNSQVAGGGDDVNALLRPTANVSGDTPADPFEDLYMTPIGDRLTTDPEPVAGTDFDVYVSGKKLAPNTDYTATIANADKAGTATVTITGAGTYAGKKTTRTFRVVAGKFKGSDVSPATLSDAVYTGKAITVDGLSVKVGDKTLVAGTDYNVYYENNTNVSTDKAQATVKFAGIGDYVGSSAEKTFKITPATLTEAMVADIPDQKFTGSAVEPDLTVTLNGVKLPANDYTVEYKDNIAEGKATATITGAGNIVGTVTKNFNITKEADATLTTLAGEKWFDTMKQVVTTHNWGTGGTVVLATADGYWDGLTAAGAAGLTGSPVIMTDKESLTTAAKELIETLQPKTILVAGGTAAVTDATVEAAATAAGLSVESDVVRMWGEKADDTACAIYKTAAEKAGGKWATTAFVCTDNGYWDALAAAPISYAKNMPVFLTRNDGAEITQATMATMKEGGVTDVFIAGGTFAVSANVEQALKDNGFTVHERLMGEKAVDTSVAIAKYGMEQGMLANNMGIATTNGYWDALCGAALCGVDNSVMVLIDNETNNSVAFIEECKALIGNVYIFGGDVAVTPATKDSITKALATVANK